MSFVLVGYRELSPISVLSLVGSDLGLLCRSRLVILDFVMFRDHPIVGIFEMHLC